MISFRSRLRRTTVAASNSTTTTAIRIEMAAMSMVRVTKRWAVSWMFVVLRPTTTVPISLSG